VGVDAFLGHLREQRAPESTLATYGRSLRRLVAAMTPDMAVADLEADETLAKWFKQRYTGAAPTYWNKERAALQAAAGWWREKNWLAGDPLADVGRLREPRDETRALTVSEVQWLLSLRAPLRERTYWTVLYETAARAEEILCLDIEDLDMPNRRGKVVSKGGATEWVYWQTGAAVLLPRLIAGRAAGPVFLASRRPNHAVALSDLCPVTGRARLSYRRAAALFAEHTAAMGGWVLHQLRHSALTHDAARGTSLPMLAARSRHRGGLRSVGRYTQLGSEVVARHVAGIDPAARRKG
jgi:integrase/recombinase XerD